MDYLIADKNLIKKDEEKYYKEKIIYGSELSIFNHLSTDKIKINYRYLEK